MPDPTELVIFGGLCAALALFVSTVLIRGTWRRPPMAVPGPDAATPPQEGTPPQLTPPVPPVPPPLPPPLLAPGLAVGKVPVGFYKPLDLLGALFVFGVFGLLALGTARASHDVVPELKPVTLLVNIGFQFFMAGLVVLWGVRRVGWPGWLGRLRWPGWFWIWVMPPCALLFMWFLLGWLQFSGYNDWMQSLGVETTQETVKLLQQSEDPLILGLMTLAAVAVAPLCEELVFRGYFYPVLKQFAGPGVAAACSALVFASAHGNLGALLPLWMFGGVLVFFYEKTGSLWAPIAVHCCFNSATVLAQFALRYAHLPLPSSS